MITIKTNEKKYTILEQGDLNADVFNTSKAPLGTVISKNGPSSQLSVTHGVSNAVFALDGSTSRNSDNSIILPVGVWLITSRVGYNPSTPSYDLGMIIGVTYSSGSTEYTVNTTRSQLNYANYLSGSMIVSVTSSNAISGIVTNSDNTTSSGVYVYPKTWQYSASGTTRTIPAGTDANSAVWIRAVKIGEVLNNG